MESSNQFLSNEGRDPELWKIAQKRAGFKRHLSVYVIMSIFFWVVWLFSGHNNYYNYNNDHYYKINFPWPLWAMFGWGIGLIFHFMGAYVYTQHNSAEKEYEKLKNRISK